MISSMTAFARHEFSNEKANFVWELRSVNHRYLDLSVRMPEQLRFLEPAVRNHINEKISRGKIEAVLIFQPGEAAAEELSVNVHQVHQLLRVAEQVNQLSYTVPLTIADILRWPGIVKSAQFDPQQMQEAILSLLDETLDQFIQMRQREGRALANLIHEKLDVFQHHLSQLELMLPKILQAMREKLKERLTDLEVTVDAQRFEQELALLIQRSDIMEEYDRLKTHLVEVRRIITEGGLVGRRLDFLMQELNREANTLGSKAIDKSLTNCVVEFKVLIEQMREQIQNLE